MMKEYKYFAKEREGQYSFYKVPKALFDGKFKELSTGSKVLYGLMLDRMGLSRKNKWADADGKVYIHFSLEHVMEYLGCAKQKAVKLMHELEEFGLIESITPRRGQSKKIYVKNYICNMEKRSADSGSYFFVGEEEQYIFYILPKYLFTEEFQYISYDSKILYSIMLSRMDLSRKNGWIDKQDQIYIQLPLAEIMQYLGCARQKAVKVMQELRESGLIDEEQDSGKLKKIYVKDFLQPESVAAVQLENPYENHTGMEIIPDQYENQTWTSMKIKPDRYENHPQTGMKIIPDRYENQTVIRYKNNTDKNNTESINLKTGYDWMDVRASVWEQIGAEALMCNYVGMEKCVEEIVDLISDVLIQPSGEVRIGKSEMPVDIVKSRYRKLKMGDIENVLMSLESSLEHGEKIRNIRSYMMTTLYNAPTTTNLYFLSCVKYDMAHPQESMKQ